MYYGQYINSLASIGIAFCISLAACSNHSEPQSYSDDGEDLSLSIPSAIAKTRINTDDLELSVSISGQNVLMTPTENADQTEAMSSNTNWVGKISVPVGQILQLSVRWSINLVVLATLDKNIGPYTSDNEPIFVPADYTYPDDDNDGFTNLQELNATPPTKVDDPLSIPTSNAAVNPQGLDANRDGIADAQDDINSDGLVDVYDMPKQYKRGNKGPAGGWVVYTADNGRSGLEVAPMDHSSLVRWYCDDEAWPAVEAHVAGSGEHNSMAMLEGCAGTGFVDAAVTADNYELNGFSDWFLPSIAELELIAEVVALDELAFFDVNIHYWSSSQHDTATSAWAYDILGEEQVLHERSDLLRVRAVRAF